MKRLVQLMILGLGLLAAGCGQATETPAPVVATREPAVAATPEPAVTATPRRATTAAPAPVATAASTPAVTATRAPVAKPTPAPMPETDDDSIPVTHDRFPGEEWDKSSSPEAAGWSSEGLSKARDYAGSIDTAAVMIVHRGRIVDEWGDTSRPFISHSMRKSLMSALYGVYVADGKIDTLSTLNELGVDDYTPLTEVEKQATVDDLLKARSGVYIPAAGEAASMKATRPERGSHLPGAFWYYNNWDFNALGTIFDQSSGEKDIYRAFEKRIAGPIGMQDFAAETLQYHYEPYSMHPYYGFLISARDLARFGLLFARGGRWGDEQVVPESWVAESTVPYSDAGAFGGYGYMWWVAADGRHLANVLLPDGSFSAQGYRGQYALIMPEWDLVIVHRVDTFIPNGEVSDSQFGHLVRLILQAGPEGLDLGVPAVDERMELSEADLKKYVGLYTLIDWPELEGDGPPLKIAIKLDGGNLVAQVPEEPPGTMIPIGPGRFSIELMPGVDLRFEMDGNKVESMIAEISDTFTLVYGPSE